MARECRSKRGFAICPERSKAALVYAAKFGPAILGGQPVTDNPNDYPAWDEVLESYRQVNGKLAELLKALPDEDIDAAMKGRTVPPQAHEFFGSIGQALSYMAMHMTHHRGQLALIQSMNA